jgi:short-subunit dehydrogenase
MTDLHRYGPWAVIAGASEGIGEHAARQLAADGFSVVLVARRQEVLDALAASIRAANPDVEALGLALDLSLDDAADRLVDAVAGLDVGLVFYNAGADTGPVLFLDRAADDVLGMVRRNVVTPTAVCHALGRRLRDRGRGGIVVIGSMAGVSGSALIATYSATKAYQQVLCEGLWRELGASGVDVVHVIAGATATPAHHRTGAVASPDHPQADPADVARNALDALGHGPVRGADDALDAGYRALAGLPREQLIELMSAGTRAVYGLPEPAPGQVSGT